MVLITGARPLVLRVLSVLLVAILAACGSTPEQRQAVATVTLAEACSAYGSALRVLATQRQIGALDPETIVTVDQLNVATDEICNAPTPPSDALDAINRVNMAVTRILLISAQNGG